MLKILRWEIILDSVGGSDAVTRVTRVFIRGWLEGQNQIGRWGPCWLYPWKKGLEPRNEGDF